MPRKPIRRGKPLSFTLDYDADALLRAMTPNSKGRGLLIGVLLRKEARERAERAKLLDLLTAEAKGLVKA
jgi:hypothetical protein